MGDNTALNGVLWKDPDKYNQQTESIPNQKTHLCSRLRIQPTIHSY